jgi:hypothetical protein
MTPDQSQSGEWLSDNHLSEKILFTRPLLWFMAGNLMSELREYMTTRRSITKKMPGKKTSLLLMFKRMSPQVGVMLKTNGGRMRI